MDTQPLKDALIERMAEKKLTIDKVSKMTGISEHYLTAFIEGDHSRLPSAPYVRGYLAKLGPLLELNPHELWELHRRELGVKSSGKTDTLPMNRFAIRRINTRSISLIIIAILVVGYFGFNFNRLFGKPTIDFVSPSEEVVAVANPLFVFAGSVRPHDTVVINDNHIFVDEFGNFEKEVNLEPGVNTFTILVSRFLGRTTEVIKEITYTGDGTLIDGDDIDTASSTSEEEI